MLPHLVLFRTQKGEDVLHGDRHAISTNLRRALLTIDGKTSVAELEKKVFWVSDVKEVLEELFAAGFVHHDLSAVQTAETAAPVQSLKVQLAALAREMLGSNSERMIKKMEEVLLGCKRTIKLTISEDLADVFWQRGRKIIGK
jgi:methyl coenzyme M reductase subunit D